MEQQTQEKRSFWTKTKSFALQCKRVLRITKKPSNEEFKIIVKVSGLGILLIGLVGFIIHILWRLLIG
ncbi:MAG: protein translocase SEC61 complex subunit gamma [Candidatus Woesearchaeota archaeon]